MEISVVYSSLIYQYGIKEGGYDAIPIFPSDFDIVGIIRGGL